MRAPLGGPEASQDAVAVVWVRDEKAESRDGYPRGVTALGCSRDARAAPAVLCSQRAKGDPRAHQAPASQASLSDSDADVQQGKGTSS